ncbi:hypothetical protein BVRB_8g190420 [Beta vulgaris subsp. vulgaris]|uniref:Uncharacterized protein n=1 Tax=Beta vulgaris subsp. vulgaris TaxID=3555 RepID=A0A0J8BUG9_BETVV|nr:hypothetical protein BVRB_8g190420 [Beta vulgaris subsp. vulgaris]
MRGALFGDQVEGYKEAFVYKGEYEIANALIKPVEEQFKSSSSELDYQMSFGRQTVIQPTNTKANPVLLEYQTISSIPKTCDPSEKFGLPLASTMSTTIIHEPNGDRAAALAEWALRHRDTLADRQARVLDVRNTSKERQVMTICALKEKKDDLETFSAIQKLLQVSFLIEVGPKTTLSLNNVLQWIIKRVVPEDEADEVNLKPKPITQPMYYHSVKPDESNPKQKLLGKSTDHNTEGAKNPTHEAAHVFVDEDVLGSTN